MKEFLSQVGNEFSGKEVRQKFQASQHVYYPCNSLLSFAEAVFGLEPLTDRDASSYDMLGCFDFEWVAQLSLQLFLRVLVIMKEMQMETLNRLWAVADQEAKKLNGNPLFVFDPIGLILVRPLKKRQYESTPMNSSAFAETGGDGVHFSLLLSNGKPSENSPIVMTVPMQSTGKENLTVGENLFDFLCLGKQIGYFWLEQLVYDETRTIDWISNPAILYEREYGNRLADSYRVNSYNKAKHLLKILRDEFKLKSWGNVKKHLDELQSSYMNLLELRPSFSSNHYTS